MKLSLPLQVDEASFLDGAHFYKHAQHSQAEVEAKSEKVINASSFGLGATSKVTGSKCIEMHHLFIVLWFVVPDFRFGCSWLLDAPRKHT